MYKYSKRFTRKSKCFMWGLYFHGGPKKPYSFEHFIKKAMYYSIGKRP